MTEVFGRPPPRGAATMSWRIFVRFLVAENAHGDLEQLPELDQSRHPGAGRRLESFVADPAEAKCAQSRVSSATPSK